MGFGSFLHVVSPTFLNFGQFQTKKFGAKIGQNFLSEIGRNKKFIMQSGYGEQTLFYKIFHLLLKKSCSFSDFTFESDVL